MIRKIRIRYKNPRTGLEGVSDCEKNVGESPDVIFAAFAVRNPTLEIIDWATIVRIDNEGTEDESICDIGNT
jgi:hypothetical protein